MKRLGLAVITALGSVIFAGAQYAHADVYYQADCKCKAEGCPSPGIVKSGVFHQPLPPRWKARIRQDLINQCKKLTRGAGYIVEPIAEVQVRIGKINGPANWCANELPYSHLPAPQLQEVTLRVSDSYHELCMDVLKGFQPKTLYCWMFDSVPPAHACPGDCPNIRHWNPFLFVHADGREQVCWPFNSDNIGRYRDFHLSVEFEPAK